MSKHSRRRPRRRIRASRPGVMQHRRLGSKVSRHDEKSAKMKMNRRTFLQQTAGSAVASGLFAAADSTDAAESQLPLIIDTHQHLWDLSKQKLPWLDSAPGVLRHSYRNEEYREATQGLNIKAVYMEVDVASGEHVAEAEYVLGLARDPKNATIAAVIGGQVAAPDFPAYLKKFKSNSLVKGVRQVLHVPGTPAGYCLQHDFVRHVRLLGEQGKSFDLCLRPTDLGDGVKLVGQCPGTRFILDHCGNPDLKSFRPARAGEEKPKHTSDEWKRAIEALAKSSNVICKISGVIANLPAGGDASELAPAVNHCLDSFGPDRVVFGGDWPVCLLGAPLKRWVEYLTQIIAQRPAGDQRKLWSGNAVKHYALKV